MATGVARAPTRAQRQGTRPRRSGTSPVRCRVAPGPDHAMARAVSPGRITAHKAERLDFDHEPSTIILAASRPALAQMFSIEVGDARTWCHVLSGGSSLTRIHFRTDPG
jgi:hypothetical protein